MKHLVNKVVTKEVEFHEGKVEIRKLSVKEVFAVQKLVKEHSKSKAEDSQVNLLRGVLRISVLGAEEMTDVEFDSFPLSSLSTLVDDVMAFSGLGEASEEVGN